MCETLSKESGGTTAAAVKKIGKARQVPFQSALDPDPFRILAGDRPDPGILGLPDGKNQGFPPEMRKEFREFNATRDP
jgi:hypothetical protein